MTIKELEELQLHPNKNYSDVYIELLHNCYNKKFICEEALISEEAEKLLENYLVLAKRTKNKNISDYCFALLKAKIEYKSESQISNDIVELMKEDRDEQMIIEMYKANYAKGTKLDTFNKCISLLK